MKRIIFLLIFSPVYLISQNCPLVCNGSFDSPTVTTGTAFVPVVNCWAPLASDVFFEVWGSGYGGVNSYDGSQHLELNANQPLSIFQDFTVAAGVNLSVSFAHRGRQGIDTIDVSIGYGVPITYTSLGRFGDGALAWATYTVNYMTTGSGNHRVKFKPVYWSGGNQTMGNFLDGVTVKAPAQLCTSIENVKANKALAVFPNPARDLLQVSSEVPMRLTLFSATGVEVVVFELMPGSNSIRLGHLPRGIYSIVTEDGLHSSLLKLALID
jgi:hypothetical protein